MKFVNVLAIVLVAIFSSCSKKEAFTVTGKTNYTGQVYLNELKGYQFNAIDTADITNGVFTFTGHVMSCDQYFLTFENKKGSYGFFLDNEEINIETSDEHPYFSQVTKSPLNLEYQTFSTKMNDLVKKQSEERQKYYAEKDEQKRNALLTVLQSYGQKQSELAQTTFNQNINKPYASTILAQYLKNSFTLDQLDSVLAKMPVEAKSNNAAKMLIADIENQRKSAEGQPYINITQPCPNGEIISLKDVLADNKCVLIDFWASWCSPCIASMPEFKRLYETYKDQGFEIYAVSVDSKKDAWVRAIKSHELPWVHVSELKGWNTKAKSDYAVKGVPSTVLINKDGVIVAKNRHGEALEEAIKECLK